MRTAPNPKAVAHALRIAAQFLSHYAGSDAAEARELCLDLAAQAELGALTPKTPNPKED